MGSSEETLFETEAERSPPRPSPGIRTNLGANMAGAGWSTLIGLAFVPVYIRLLGIEGYALIGFYYLLQTLLAVFDFGISPTVNRELARHAASNEAGSETVNFVRTIEVVYISIGLVIGIAIALASPLIITHWLRGDGVSNADLSTSLLMMAAIIAIQWPVNLYQSALLGLQRQVKLNAIRMVMITVSHGGAALVLLAVSRTIPAFFGWQIIVASVSVIWLAFAVWGVLRERTSARARFDGAKLRLVWRFAAGMTWISLAGIVLSQMDKLIVSKLLDLTAFGYYVLAATLGGGLVVLIGPVFNTFFPRLCAGVAVGDLSKLAADYHAGAKIMAVVILPPAAVIGIYSHEILRIWTGNAEAALQAGPIAAVLVTGTAFNALMNMPYGLQLAYGWTKLAGALSFTVIVLMVPTTVFLANSYGAVGAALGWASLNVFYFLIGIPITHRWLLRGHGVRMVLSDVLPAGLVSVAIAYGSTFLVRSITEDVAIVTAVAAILTLTWLAAGLAAFPLHRLRDAVRLAIR